MMFTKMALYIWVFLLVCLSISFFKMSRLSVTVKHVWNMCISVSCMCLLKRCHIEICLDLCAALSVVGVMLKRNLYTTSLTLGVMSGLCRLLNM